MNTTARSAHTATEERFAAHVNPGRQRLLEKFLGANPILAEREGPRFRNASDGRWYWNCHCNGGVFNLGHRHPQVVDALRAGLDSLDVGNMWLVSEQKADLAERLSATTGHQLPGVVFAGVGGEAVDAALKLAHGHTHRDVIVAAENGYHGHTGLAVATGHPKFLEPFHLHPTGVRRVPFNNFAALDAAIDDDVAAVILEPIQATGGMLPAEAGYLESAQQLCRERGSLLILDEVQTGLGRTGTMWFHQQFGLKPDMLITGKGLSGSMFPMAAVLVRAGLLDVFAEEPFAHVSTFAGSDLGCLASLAVLDVLEQPGFQEHVVELGERFEAGLEGLGFQLRRRGLFMGFKWPRPDGGVRAAQQLIRNDVWAVMAGNDDSVTQFLPPMILTDEQADEIIALVRRALA